MTVYILKSSWNYCGNNSVNEIDGIFKNLIDAQKCLCRLLYNDCNFCKLKHYEDDCKLELNLPELLQNDQPYPATYARFDDGLEYPEEWVEHTIEARICQE